jgi:hypothetical protein
MIFCVDLYPIFEHIIHAPCSLHLNVKVQLHAGFLCRLLGLISQNIPRLFGLLSKKTGLKSLPVNEVLTSTLVYDLKEPAILRRMSLIRMF